jgi:hypothetical protein
MLQWHGYLVLNACAEYFISNGSMLPISLVNRKFQ